MAQSPNIAFGGGSAEGTMSLIGLSAMLITLVLILVLPRKWVVVPLLSFAILVPGQQFVIAGVHLFAVRIVVLCGCLRFLLKSAPTKGRFAGGFTSIDKVFLTWSLCRATAFMLLYHVGDAVVNV